MAWRIDPEGAETDALARLAPVDGLRVLELGCGDGRLTFRSVDLPNAEVRLKEAVRAGLYTLEAETEFDVLQHFDRAEELLEAKEERLAAQPALVRRIRAATPPLVTRERAVFRRLRAVPAPTNPRDAAGA